MDLLLLILEKNIRFMIKMDKNVNQPLLLELLKIRMDLFTVMKIKDMDLKMEIILFLNKSRE
jgi:hypothetical protein